MPREPRLEWGQSENVAWSHRERACAGPGKGAGTSSGHACGNSMGSKLIARVTEPPGVPGVEGGRGLEGICIRWKEGQW